MWFVPALVAVTGVFDLVCTLTAYENGWLVELNPLAALSLEQWGASGLAVYRFALTALGCVFLSWGLRAHHARRFTDSPRERARIGAVILGGQTAILAAHVTLVAWWIAWLSV